MKLNKSNIVIREAEPSDAEALVKYVRMVAGESNFLTFGADEWKMTIEQERNFIESHRSGENTLIIIAEDEGKIVGLLNVHATHKKRLKHIGELGITVAQSHWGLGLGSDLIEYMLNWAKENLFIRKINLTVNANNSKAIHVYKKFGFEIEGVIRRDFYFNGEFQDSHIMGLLIDKN